MKIISGSDGSDHGHTTVRFVGSWEEPARLGRQAPAPPLKAARGGVAARAWGRRAHPGFGSHTRAMLWSSSAGNDAPGLPLRARLAAGKDAGAPPWRSRAAAAPAVQSGWLGPVPRRALGCRGSPGWLETISVLWELNNVEPWT